MATAQGPGWRRLARWASLLLLVPVLAFAWLLCSAGGRDWAMARLAAALPQELRWERLDGRLADTLQLRGLAVAGEDWRFSAALVELHWQPLALLRNRLGFASVRIVDGELHLPAQPASPAGDLWPSQAPTLPLPVAVHIDTLQLAGLRIHASPESSWELGELRAMLALQHQGLGLQGLDARGDFGRLEGRLHYWPAAAQQLAADLRWTPAEPGAKPLHLSADGDAEAIRLEVDGALPEPLRLDLQGHRTGTDWQWQGQAKSAGLHLATFGIDDPALWRFDLAASAAAGRIDLAGELERDGFRLELQPSQLQLQGRQIALAPLDLTLPWGRLAVQGAVDTGDPQLAFALTGEAPALEWRGSDPTDAPIRSEARVQLAGNRGQWQLEGEASLQRPEGQAMLVFAGSGGSAGLQLPSIRLQTPGGWLQAAVGIDWSEALAIELEGRLQEVDPGFLLPDWPGRLQGRVQARAQRQADGHWQGTFDLPALRGQLRQRPLQAEAHWQGAWPGGEGQLDLRLGASRVQAKARLGDSPEWSLRALPLQLDDLWPEAGGRLRGEASQRPDGLRVDLTGENLRWAEATLAQLHLRGHLPAGTEGELQLQGTGLAAPGLMDAGLSLRYRGDRNRGALAASLHAPEGPQLQLESRILGDRGELQSLLLQLPRSPNWALRAPATWQLQDGQLQLPSACLLADGGGEACLSLAPQRLRLELAALPLALLQPWLPEEPALTARGEVGGWVEASRRGGPWQGEAQLRSGQGVLHLAEPPQRALLAYRDWQAEVRFDAGGLRLRSQAQLDREGRLHAELALPWDSDAPWQGRLELAVNALDWLELLSPDIAAPRGRLQGELQLAGSRAAPQFGGQLALVEAALELPALGLQLQDGRLQMLAEADGRLRLAGGLQSGDGRLRIDGHWPASELGGLQLQLTGQRVRLADTPELQLTADPDLDLQLHGDRLRLRGSLDVGEARIDLERLDGAVAASPDVIVRGDDAADAGPAWRRDLDLRLRLGDAVRLRGFGLDGHLRGELRLREGDGRPPRGSGRLEVSGHYRAYGQSLEIARGQLRYADGPLDDPALDLRVQRKVNEVEVGLEVRGRASSPRSRLVASPPMDNSEALAWLLLGRPLAGTSRAQAEQLGSAAQALNAGGSLLARSIGARLGLDEAGVEESRSLGGSVLQVGKYLTPRLFIGYGVSLIGAGQVVTLKYALPRGFALTIESGRENSASVQWEHER